MFANASLQWIDDHLNLLARMRTALGRDGQLAFQVPANYRHPSHLLAQEVANEPPFIDALYGDVPEDRGRFVLSPELYADLLYELGAKDQVVRMEVYGHELESTGEVVEWVMGTLLTPYRKRLSSGAVRRVRRALPGAADRRARGARAVLLRVPAHPLLGALQLSAEAGRMQARTADAAAATRGVSATCASRRRCSRPTSGCWPSRWARWRPPPTGSTSTSWTGTSSPT